jgi:hypothetical protein
MLRTFLSAWSVAALAALALGALPALAGGGNSDAAHACQKGGYAHYTRADGTRFANTGECVSYAAHGGVLMPIVPTTISTSLYRDAIPAGSTDYDTATLSGQTATAGGFVTYSVYSDSTCSTLVQTAGTVLVHNGHVPDSFIATFPNPGTYYWQAAYTGDSNNLPSVSPCGSEVLTVTPRATPTISTSLFRSSIPAGSTDFDSATLSGATAGAGGFVTYSVYSDASCTTLAQTAGTVLVSNGHVPDSFVATFPTPGTYYWQAAYTGDANNAPAVSPCGSEVLTVTALATPTIATSLFRSSIPAGGTDFDSATLSGATADAGGFVTYSVYSDASCTTLVQTAGTVLVFNSHVPDSFVATFPTPGTYYWQAAYTGDANNAPAVSPCGSEVLTVS